MARSDVPWCRIFRDQAVVLQEQQPDHEPRRNPRTSRRPVQVRQLAVDPRPVELVGQSSSSASRTSSCRMLIMWSSRAWNRSPEPLAGVFDGRITSPFSLRKGNHDPSWNGTEIAGFRASKPRFPAIPDYFDGMLTN